tara:strand:+ start:140 stop:1909 length:1770 start_codon:yes stop_codon:yes gene_type:complete
MSFWNAEDKVPISQTKISIPAQHGLEYSPGQKCEFHIPPSIGFLQPRESYLNIGVKISDPGLSTEAIRLQLDAQTGGQVLIKDLRIYSGGAGRILLEEYQNYNVFTALKYDYETNDSIKAKRGLTEGATVYSQQCRSDHGMPQTLQNNATENPYYKPYPVSASFSAPMTNGSYTEVKCLLPLNTGLFSNEKIFPVAMTEGLVVEMIFEDARKVMRTLDTTNRHRHLQANPFFMSQNGSNSAPSFPAAANGSAFREFFVRRDNSMGSAGSIKNFPFAINERVGFFNASDGLDNPSNGFGEANPKVERVEYVAGTTNAIKVRLNGSFRPTRVLNQEHVLYSRTVLDAATFTPTYTITDAHFVIQKVEMPPGYTTKLASMMKSGGAMNYDFLSATNYKISQLKSERVANLRLPLTQSRAKSILCIPTDASASGIKDLVNASTTYTECYDLGTDATDHPWNVNHSQRTGLTGCVDNLSAYQLFYDGKLNPSRKVFTTKLASKKSVDAQPLIELEKALVMSGIKPFSLQSFRENFCLGRALSLQNGVYDARGKDFALQVEYTESDAPTVDKLWMNWCVHLRRIVIKGDSIALEI